MVDVPDFEKTTYVIVDLVQLCKYLTADYYPVHTFQMHSAS